MDEPCGNRRNALIKEVLHEIEEQEKAAIDKDFNPAEARRAAANAANAVHKFLFDFEAWEAKCHVALRSRYDRNRCRAAWAEEKLTRDIERELRCGQNRVTTMLPGLGKVDLSAGELRGMRVDLARGVLVEGHLIFGGIRIEPKHAASAASAFTSERSALLVASEADVRRELDKIAIALGGRQPPAQEAIVDQVRSSLSGKIISRDRCRELIRKDERLYRAGPGRRQKQSELGGKIAAAQTPK